MALTTAQLVTQLYVGFYNRAPDPEGLNYWIGRVNAGVSLADIANSFAASPEAISTYPYLALPNVVSPESFLNSIYMNLFGRPIDTGAGSGLEYYSAMLASGVRPGEVLAKIQLNANTNAGTADQAYLANKVAAGEYFANQAANKPGFVYNDAAKSAAAAAVSTVTADPASVEASKDASDFFFGPNGPTGDLFALTKGLDIIQGTAGNDVIYGGVDNGNAELNTLNAQDVINGGAGFDTLKIAHNDDGANAAAIPVANLTSIEAISVESTASQGVTIDTSAVAGVTNLDITKAAADVKATAAATTDIGVAIKAVGASVVADGGNNVAVTLSDVKANTNSVTIGGTTAAKGDVVVNTTAAAAVNGTNFAMGAVTVTGGKTVSVTQKVGDAAGLVSTGAATTHAQGAVNVNAGAETTTVTVKQSAAATAASVVAVAGSTEAASVKFAALANGDSATVGGLTFTAGKALTAAEVAQAFSNLLANAAKPGVATGDTQGASAAANGKFTGSLVENWSSAAASGDTVVFTAKANTDIADLAGSAKATVTTTTQGVDAVEGKNVLGVVAGTVTVAGAAALKTVSIDSYGAASSITGATNTALESVSIANGAGFTIDSAASTLGLNANSVSGTVEVTAGTKTLNAEVNGTATQTVALKSGTVETLNIKGDGNVSGTIGDLGVVKTISTADKAAGTSTFTIDGTKTTYTGGAGVDNVTVDNAGTAITKAISLGAGDDTLTLNGSVVVPTATLSGGEGTNTIAMNAASAASLSANGDFAAKIDGFQKLSINNNAAIATTINMANMDGIKYVVSNNSTDVATAATKTTFTATVSAASAENGDQVTFNGKTYTFTSAAADATAFATQLYSLMLADQPNNGATGWVVTGVSGSALKFEAFDAGVKATPAAGTFVFVDQGAVNSATFVTATDTAGAAASTAPALTIEKIANDGTVELVAAGDGVVVKLADASGTADSFNIVTKVAGGDLSFGEVNIAGVETLTLNAVDTAVPPTAGAAVNKATLEINADAAKSLAITGNSHVSLTLDGATNKLATVDASALTGNLTFSASGAVATTITSGSGADVLAASVGTNAKADVIKAGDGNDTITLGSNGAKVWGEAGNDIFILGATAANAGTKEANTYSSIEDFSAGDVLQLKYWNAGQTDVASFGKLAAVLDENTAVFSDFVNAAITQADVGDAVWFNFKGDAYVVVDSDANSAATFANGTDLIVKLTGVDGNNLSWNSDFASVALA